MFEFTAVHGIEILGLIGFVAFIVSVIIQLIKELPYIRKIPTQIVVVALSIVLCVLGYLAYCSYYHLPVLWYMILCAIIGAFIIAYVAMYGFDALKKLYDRWCNIAK